VGREKTGSDVLGCGCCGRRLLHLGVLPRRERRGRFRGRTTLIGPVRCHPGCLTVAGRSGAVALPFIGDAQSVACVKRDPAGDVRARERCPAADPFSLRFVPEHKRAEPETRTEAQALPEAYPFTISISIALAQSVALAQSIALALPKSQ
jgi:hypothetical protein